MKKVKFQTISLLVIIVLFISLMHACSREHCRTCRAKDNGVEVEAKSVCSDEERASFEAEHYDDEVTCE